MGLLEFFRRKPPLAVDSPRCRVTGPKGTVIIHHYCPHTFNAGDHFVVRSIRQHVRRRIPNSLFIPKACADNRGWGKPIGLRGENIGFSNRYADAVIIGGSDQYNNWSLRIRAEEVRELAPPLFLVGLGVSSRSLDGEPRIDDPRYLADIRATNEAARMSSVRDGETDAFLRKLGVTKQVMTGCPALYLFDGPFQARPDGPVVFTFPFPVVHGKREKFSALKELLDALLAGARSRGDECVICCHDDRDVTLAQELYPGERLFFSNYVEDYFPFYRAAKLVVGSRLHATILAGGMGVPFVNVNLDLRGRGYSRTFGLETWNVDWEAPDLQNQVLERYARIREGDLRVFEDFYERKLALRKAFDAFFDEMCDGILHARP